MKKAPTATARWGHARVSTMTQQDELITSFESR